MGVPFSKTGFVAQNISSNENEMFRFILRYPVGLKYGKNVLEYKSCGSICTPI